MLSSKQIIRHKIQLGSVPGSAWGAPSRWKGPGVTTFLLTRPSAKHSSQHTQRNPLGSGFSESPAAKRHRTEALSTKTTTPGLWLKWPFLPIPRYHTLGEVFWKISFLKLLGLMSRGALVMQLQDLGQRSYWINIHKTENLFYIAICIQLFRFSVNFRPKNEINLKAFVKYNINCWKLSFHTMWVKYRVLFQMQHEFFSMAQSTRRREGSSWGWAHRASSL